VAGHARDGILRRLIAIQEHHPGIPMQAWNQTSVETPMASQVFGAIPLHRNGGSIAMLWRQPFQPQSLHKYPGLVMKACLEMEPIIVDARIQQKVAGRARDGILSRPMVIQERHPGIRMQAWNQTSAEIPMASRRFGAIQPHQNGGKIADPSSSALHCHRDLLP